MDPSEQPPSSDDATGMLPVADQPAEELARLERVCEVAAYSSSTSVSGFGQINGFEFVFAGGGMLQYGKCSGKRECLQLGERESIIRLAGRTDLGRRQRGASSEGGCLVSLQVTTSKSREIIFGRSHRMRTASSFSLVAEYRTEVVGCRILAPDVPIVTALITQERRDLLDPSAPVSQLLSSAHTQAIGETVSSMEHLSFFKHAKSVGQDMALSTPLNLFFPRRAASAQVSSMLAKPAMSTMPAMLAGLQIGPGSLGAPFSMSSPRAPFSMGNAARVSPVPPADGRPSSAPSVSSPQAAPSPQAVQLL